MIEGCELGQEEKVGLSKKVVEQGDELDVSVEGEVGVLGGVEDEVCGEEESYSKGEEVMELGSRRGWE